MGVNTTIQTALDARLKSCAGNIDIAYPNTQYTEVLKVPYLFTTLLPALTTPYLLDTTYKHQGIYQIDVHVPAGTGMLLMYTLLDQITTGFKANLTLAPNMFVQAISRGKSQRQDSWFVSNIQINYTYYGV